MSIQLEHLKTSHWRPDETCSYCGSLSPEAFFRAIIEGCEIGPTDKNYKAYVDLREPHLEELHIVSAVNFQLDPERVEREHWTPIAEVDPDMLKRDGWSAEHKTFVQIRPRGPKKFGKFYFQHLSVDERKRFVELLNTKAIKIGAPGYFYVLPFFCVRPETACDPIGAVQGRTRR